MVVFDTSVLLLFLDEDAEAPQDPETGSPVAQAQERIIHLVEQLSADQTTVIIPTPELSEILVHAGHAGPSWLNSMTGHSAFKIAPFNELAAVELAAINAKAIRSGDKRNGISDPWAKVKFDRQIVAIAKVAHASIVYSDDDNLLKHAVSEGLSARRTRDLPLPPTAAQIDLDLPPLGE